MCVCVPLCVCVSARCFFPLTKHGNPTRFEFAPPMFVWFEGKPQDNSICLFGGTLEETHPYVHRIWSCTQATVWEAAFWVSPLLRFEARPKGQPLCLMFDTDPVQMIPPPTMKACLALCQTVFIFPEGLGRSLALFFWRGFRFSIEYQTKGALFVFPWPFEVSILKTANMN